MQIKTSAMTGKQKFIQIIYPTFTWLTRLFGNKNKTMTNEQHIKPTQSFYDLAAEKNGGGKIDMKEFKGKKVLLVNTASHCGYTPQYDELQKLYEQYNSKLVIIGFPANDFMEQEKGSDEEIAEFCKINYGVSFPLAKKSVVVSGAQQNPVFNWLTDKARNGWSDQVPTWNFSKYLVDEEGTLTHYFDPSVSPMGNEVIRAVTEK